MAILASIAMSRLRAFADHHRRELPLAILLIAAAAHGYFFFNAGSHFRWDSTEYLQAAQNLAAGHGFRNGAGAIEARRTPGYPLFIASFLSLGSGVTGIIIAQHLISILLAPIVYFVTLAFTHDFPAAAFAGLFVAIDSGQIYMANHVMTETLMSALLLALVAGMAWFARRGSLLLAAAAGVLVSISVLVRPAAVYLWIPLTLWTCAAAPKRRWIAGATFAGCAVLLPLLWTWRNYERVGAPALSSIIGEDLYYWRAAGAVAMEKTGFTFVPLPFSGEEAYRKDFFRVTQRQFVTAANEAHLRTFGPRAATLTEAQISDFDGTLARNILLSHWRGAVLMTINGALHLMFDATWDYASELYGGWTWVVVTVILFVNSVISVILALIGFERLLRIDARIAWLFAAVLLYFVAVLSGPEHEQWRYRVPLIPLVAVLVSCSVVSTSRG